MIENIMLMRFINTLFFSASYSVPAPLLYIAIIQVLPAGDVALNSYAFFEAVLVIIAYVSLATTLGFDAAQKSSPRKHPYPAVIDALIFLWVHAATRQASNGLD